MAPRPARGYREVRCRVVNWTSVEPSRLSALPWNDACIFGRRSRPVPPAIRADAIRSEPNARARREFQTSSARVESLRFGVFSGFDPLLGFDFRHWNTSGSDARLGVDSRRHIAVDFWRGVSEGDDHPRGDARDERALDEDRVSRRTNAPPPRPRSTTRDSSLQNARWRLGTLKETRHLSLNETRHLSLNETRHLSLSSRRPSRVRGGVRLCRRRRSAATRARVASGSSAPRAMRRSSALPDRRDGGGGGE